MSAATIGVPRTLSAIERAELITYSPWVAVVFILNMMMGSGPIALPYGFWSSGVGLASVFLAFITLIAFMTVTFLVETIVIGNVLLKFRGDIGVEPVFERKTVKGRTVYRAITPSRAWKIEKRLEIGQLAEIFFPSWGVVISYCFMLVYTLGVLSVYAVAVPEALQGMLDQDVIGISPYYFILAVFAIIAVPFSFGNFQNTRVLQIVVIVLRFLCVGCMVYGTLTIISTGDGVPSHNVLEDSVQTSGLPWMIGNSIFTFMVHHSVPGIAAPVKPQQGLKKALAVAFSIGLFAYLVLCGSAVFAFDKIDGIYNLNFTHFRYKPVALFLQVYPTLVVALFPLVCITLRNNIANVVNLVVKGSDFSKLTGQATAFGRRISFVDGGESASLLTPSSPSSLNHSARAPPKQPPPSFRRQAMFTLIAATPPLVIAACTKHIQIVITITGSLPGIGLMLLIPCALVYRARRALLQRVVRSVNKRASPGPNFGRKVDPMSSVENPQMSPFGHTAWLVVIVAIGVGCCAFDAYSLVSSFV